VLLGRAAEALADGGRRHLTVTLPSGAIARMHCNPVRSGGRLAGGVVHLSSSTSRPDRNEGPADAADAAAGLVDRARSGTRLPRGGGGTPFGRVAGAGRRAGRRQAGDRAGCAPAPQSVRPTPRPSTPPARKPRPAGGPAPRAACNEADTLVIRHVDRLSAPRLRSLRDAAEAVTASQYSSVWVVVTLSSAGENVAANKGPLEAPAIVAPGSCGGRSVPPIDPGSARCADRFFLRSVVRGDAPVPAGAERLGRGHGRPRCSASRQFDRTQHASPRASTPSGRR